MSTTIPKKKVLRNPESRLNDHINICVFFSLVSEIKIIFVYLTAFVGWNCSFPLMTSEHIIRRNSENPTT